MNIREHIDALFADYSDTVSMQEFKEELAGNLIDRIAVLRKKGLDENDALKKALEELGDVSAIAEELSLKKKQEVFSDMYMGPRRYLTPLRAALFTLGGLAVCFGLIVSVLTWSFTDQPAAFWAAGMPFIVFGAGFLTYMCLTQETGAKNPMSWKRSILYAASIAIFLFGVMLVPITYFSVTDGNLIQRALRYENQAGFVPADSEPDEFAADVIRWKTGNYGLGAATAVLIPFALPGMALFVFLALTEKDRSKPWAAGLHGDAVRR